MIKTTSVGVRQYGDRGGIMSGASISDPLAPCIVNEERVWVAEAEGREYKKKGVRGVDGPAKRSERCCPSNVRAFSRDLPYSFIIN